MKKIHISNEFILTTAAADIVNWWLLRNDVSSRRVRCSEGTAIFNQMDHYVREQASLINATFEGELDDPLHEFISVCCVKSLQWIDEAGEKVNQYIHYINRVCEIREAILTGLLQLEEEEGFRIEGEIIYEKQTNHWLKQAQNLQRFSRSN